MLCYLHEKDLGQGYQHWWVQIHLNTKKEEKNTLDFKVLFFLQSLREQGLLKDRVESKAGQPCMNRVPWICCHRCMAEDSESISAVIMLSDDHHLRSVSSVWAVSCIWKPIQWEFFSCHQGSPMSWEGLAAWERDCQVPYLGSLEVQRRLKEDERSRYWPDCYLLAVRRLFSPSDKGVTRSNGWGQNASR